MFRPEEIELQVNYVLIKPYDDHTHFHVNGKEFLEIGKSCERDLAPEDSLESDMQETNDNIAHSWATTAKVYAVPKKLQYNGAEIKRMYGNVNAFDKSEVEKFQRLNDQSVEFGVPMEVEVGDDIMFIYNEHIVARENGRVIDTPLGEMYLIKYDTIEAKKDGDTLYPLNGYVFFELDEHKLESKNLHIFQRHEELYDKRGAQSGTVTRVGHPIGGTKAEFFDKDPTEHIKPGDKIYFSGFDASEVEADNHLILFGGRKIYKIRRTDIIASADGRV